MKKVLVIEDEDAVLENIMEIIEELDYDVIGANNGIKGIELARKHLPDLIVCDIMMPELDGFGVLKALQDNESTSSVPFIFLTAKADKDDLREGMNLGADDYLTKPFTPDQLYKAIEVRMKKTDNLRKDSEKNLDELRQNLTTSLPHEFRTPLNGIMASSQFLIEYFDSLESEEVVQLHKNIYTSAQRLHRLILNYLFYADIEILSKDREQLEKLTGYVTSNPVDIITSAFEKEASEFERVDDLHYELDDTPVRIMQEHLLKICEELSNNAFKFSDKGTPLEITSSVEGNLYRLSIKDYGRGMSADQIRKIGAFVQFDRRVYEQQGPGLGLVSLKRIAEVYGGVFKIDSEFGKYTEATIYLPVAG